MHRYIAIRYLMFLAVFALLSASMLPAGAALTQKHYYAHDAVEDSYGVIAPWYTGLNGQCDYRVRIAAETMKRYTWTDPSKAPSQYPGYIWTGQWSISPEGAITCPEFNEWDNGDMGQRAANVLMGLVAYYQYSGDPAAIAHMKWQADFLLDYCQTDDSHQWPKFLISVPYKGKQYGKCSPDGMIQLDIVAEVGLGLLKTYEITGDTRYFAAAKHWADLLTEHRDKNQGLSPWPRYANPEKAPWPSFGMTGGVADLLYFFDELIRLGYTGPNNSIVESRDVGKAYFRDVLLPKWEENETWAYNYWDVPSNWQQICVTDVAARYMMDNKTQFPNWQNDVRNILTVFLNRTSPASHQRGEVYSGAWAYPESFGCCNRSLWYSPLIMAVDYAQYGVESGSEWGMELARRQQILATYDIHETGYSEDNIDGGMIVNWAWFKIAHPIPLRYVLGTIAWMPEELGANRENHIVRSTSTITSVVYSKGQIKYSTFDAPSDTIEVLRLAFAPSKITADGKKLKEQENIATNGYTVKSLPNGDAIVTVRHGGSKDIVIEGKDPQSVVDDNALTYTGDWRVSKDAAYYKGKIHTASQAGASISYTFTGNQVRLIGSVDGNGGQAEVYVDGVKQLVGIDYWNPSPRHQQVLYYINGLNESPHTIKIVALATKNPYSNGTAVNVDQIEWSTATGVSGYGEGGGPTDMQRVIMGYTGRYDYTDSQGNTWRPGTEFAIHNSPMFDTVASAWWTEPAPNYISDTLDQELYKYGAHAKDFSVNFTVGPGTYHIRFKFAATRNLDFKSNCVTIYINDEKIVDKMDVAATAGETNKAVDLVFNNIKPKNGIVDVHFVGEGQGEAFVQAIEVGPGDGGQGATPVSIN